MWRPEVPLPGGRESRRREVALDRIYMNQSPYTQTLTLLLWWGCGRRSWWGHCSVHPARPRAGYPASSPVSDLVALFLQHCYPFLQLHRINVTDKSQSNAATALPHNYIDNSQINVSFHGVFRMLGEDSYYSFGKVLIDFFAGLIIWSLRADILVLPYCCWLCECYFQFVILVLIVSQKQFELCCWGMGF